MKKVNGERKFNLARLLSNCNRYVDDVIVLNYKNFDNRTSEIYPQDLILEKNGNNDKLVNYLDMTISIDDNGVSTNLYNKVNDFNFLVVTFTFPSSNIPINLGYSIFFRQILRYSMICTNKQNFLIKSNEIFKTLNKRGYKRETLHKRFIKVFNKDHFLLYKFGYRRVKEASDDFVNIINNT